MKTLDQAIDKIIEGLLELKNIAKNAPITNHTNHTNKTPINPEDELQSLINVLNTDDWPEAVNPNMICDKNNTKDMMDRGNGVIRLMIDEDIKDVKFLDFGCEKGYVNYQAANSQAKIAVGYDIKEFDQWRNFEQTSLNNYIFTNSWDHVVKNGPYDVVLLLDVIDHLVSDSPIEVLNKINSVLSPNGSVYMRTHPFTSRHAIHQYQILNKAYLHLVFTQEELSQIDKKFDEIEPNFRISYPLMEYQKIIDQTDLIIDRKREMKQEAEQFFKTPMIAKRIMKTLNMLEYPQFQMSLQFVDYKLKRKSLTN